MRAAIYARCSTVEQTTENQLRELRSYVAARGWKAIEYVDEGISGSKDSRPALDRLLGAARRRKLDAIIVWRLDRLGRNLRHLVVLLDELSALGISFISLNEGIDFGTPAGKLQFHVLAALAEFERSRIQERVRAGLARVRAEGKRLGRPKQPLPIDRLRSVDGMPVRSAAKHLGIARSTLQRWRAEARRIPLELR